jgi:putative transposase
MPETKLVNKKRWRSSRTSVHNCAYHIIFCPKYRRKVLTGEIEARLREALLEKAMASGWEIAKLEIMPDHVHLFVKAHPVDAPHFIVGQLKGYSAHQLRQQFPELKRRMGTLWTRSYYIETIGHISEPTILKYIENQKREAAARRLDSSHG